MRDRGENRTKPMYERIYQCLMAKGCIAGREIKQNDVTCSQIASEALGIGLKPSHISYVRKKYNLTWPGKPPTTREIDEAILGTEAIPGIISVSDIALLRQYNVYRVEFGNGRVDVCFGLPPAAQKQELLLKQSFVALGINDPEMADLVSAKIGKHVKPQQIAYWRRQYGVAASHIGHGGKREYIPNLEGDAGARLQREHEIAVWILSQDRSFVSYFPPHDENRA